MGNTRFYIPITIVSFILIVYSLLIFVPDNKYTPSINYSLEFDTVIHHNYSRPLSLTQAEELKTTFSESLSDRFVLLFISGSDECSNCLNEISDYISLAKENEVLIDNYSSFLLFHGVDEQQSQRFIRVSGISGIIDGLAFTETSNLPQFDYGHLIPQYGAQNLLYLLDMEANVMFHGFVLPAGNTTKWDVKEIAFNDAMVTYTQNNNQKR